MERITIQKAGTGDFPGIYRLLRQLWPDKKPDEAGLKRVFMHSLRNRRYRAFTARANGIVLGFAGTTIMDSLWQGGTMCRLNELVTDESARGIGIGSKLLKAVEEYAEKNKCGGVDLESAAYRKKAHKFYKDRAYTARALFFVKLFKKNN